MEENNVIEMQDQEINEIKESKVKGFFGKIGSGIKKNWKTIIVGTGALAVGFVLGSKKTITDGDIIEEVTDSIEDVAETL